MPTWQWNLMCSKLIQRRDHSRNNRSTVSTVSVLHAVSALLPNTHNTSCQLRKVWLGMDHAPVVGANDLNALNKVCDFMVHSFASAQLTTIVCGAWSTITPWANNTSHIKDKIFGPSNVCYRAQLTHSFIYQIKSRDRSLIPIHHHSNQIGKSFFPSTINAWNSLPSNIRTSTTIGSRIAGNFGEVLNLANWRFCGNCQI